MYMDIHYVARGTLLGTVLCIKLKFFGICVVQKKNNIILLKIKKYLAASNIIIPFIMCAWGCW